MVPWLLLILTAVFAIVSVRTLLWASSVRRAPFSVIAPLWKGGLSHLSLKERSAMMEQFASVFAAKIALLLLLLTVCFAVLTVRVFLSVEG
jgi:hypothetical protein